MQVASIGGACVDRSYTVRGAVLGSSNPGERAPRLFGGVARNVCENLARLGIDTALVSVVGDDADGRAMLDELRSCGARVDLVKIAEGACDEYAAILDGGALVIGAADMRAIERFSVADLMQRWEEIAGARFVFADCNVAPGVLNALAQPRTGGFRLAVDAVSEPKARRLPKRLDGIDVLFINEGEARAYLGCEAEPAEAAAALLARGARSVVLTRAERGVICGDENGLAETPAVRARRVSATGAGDALAAGTLCRLLAGEELRDAVRTGGELAALTLESPRSVRADLSIELLEARLGSRYA